MLVLDKIQMLMTIILPIAACSMLNIFVIHYTVLCARSFKTKIILLNTEQMILIRQSGMSMYTNESNFSRFFGSNEFFFC